MQNCSLTHTDISIFADVPTGWLSGDSADDILSRFHGANLLVDLDAKDENSNLGTRLFCGFPPQTV